MTIIHGISNETILLQRDANDNPSPILLSHGAGVKESVKDVFSCQKIIAVLSDDNVCILSNHEGGIFICSGKLAGVNNSE